MTTTLTTKATKDILDLILERITVANSVRDVGKGIPVNARANEELTRYQSKICANAVTGEMKEHWHWVPQALVIDSDPNDRTLFRICEIKSVGGDMFRRSPFMDADSLLTWIDGWLDGWREAWSIALDGGAA